MLTVIVILIIVLLVALKSETHAMGIWLLMMVSHNLIASQIGSSAAHMPAVAGLIIATTIVARRKWSGISTTMLLLLVALIVVMAAAAIFGINAPRSLIEVLLYSKGFILVVLLAGTIKNHSQVACLTKYFLVGVFIAVGMTFFEHLTGSFVVQGEDVHRAGRFTGNPNETAMLLLTGIPLALFWGVNSKRVSSRIFNFALIALIIGAITFTQSRSGFVSLILLLLMLYIRKPSIPSTLTGFVILSAGLLFVSTNSEFWSRMGTIVGVEKEQGTSISMRRHYVESGLLIILKDPILGVGMGNFGRAMIAVDPSYRETDINRVAHNLYVEIFVENGVIGGLLFMALLGIAVLHALRYDRRSGIARSSYGLGFCIAMSLLALLITGLFSSTGKSSVLWFFVGIGLAFGQMIKYRMPVIPQSMNRKTLADY